MKKIFMMVALMTIAIASSFAQNVEILVNKYVESSEAAFYCTKPFEGTDGYTAVSCTNPYHCEQRILGFKDSTTAYFFCQAYKATCRSLTAANIDEVMISLNDLFRMFKYESAEIVGYYSIFDGYLIVTCYNVEEK